MYIHKNGIALRKLERTDLPKLKDLKNESWFGTHNITLLNDYEQEKSPLSKLCKQIVQTHEFGISP